MPEITRRMFLANTMITASTIAVASAFAPAAKKAKLPAKLPGRVVINGHIRQSVCAWSLPFAIEDLAAISAAIGLSGIDLVAPDQFPILKKHSLIGTMTPSHGIARGFNRKEHHAECIQKVREAIEATAAAGFPNVICFSGNRAGMPDEQGLKNCAEGLKKIIGFAEEKKVTLCMELLNSKVNHKDYMCDSTAWGVKLCKAVGSERFKLLFDIYHMAVQGEDVIAMIKQHKDYIAHYHTAGVPGRHEIDNSQTLDYPVIMRSILGTGFKGCVGQEFTPTRDPITSLVQAVKICDVESGNNTQAKHR